MPIPVTLIIEVKGEKLKIISNTNLGLDMHLTSLCNSCAEEVEDITLWPHAWHHSTRVKNPTWERTRLLLSSKSKLLLPCNVSVSTSCSTSPNGMEFSSKSAKAAIVSVELRRWKVPLEKASQSLLPLLRLVSGADTPELSPEDRLVRTKVGPALDWPRTKLRSQTFDWSQACNKDGAGHVDEWSASVSPDADAKRPWFAAPNTTSVRWFESDESDNTKVPPSKLMDDGSPA
jgi:hypothetical protein